MIYSQLQPANGRQYLEKKHAGKQSLVTAVGNNLSEHAMHQIESKVSSPTCAIRVPSCMLAQDFKCADLMRNAPQCPPCTTDTLHELDLQSIQHNLNLRVDLNFDHDLFFQPVSGKKGDAKRAESEKYWQSLVTEFRIYYHDLQPSCPQCLTISTTSAVRFDQRLPSMFRNLKEIVEMLVPDAEHEEVAGQLDVDLLMQQVRHGALDIVRLSDWLTTLLTSHCAPMRDETAKQVATQIRTGAEQADMQEIVGGIEKLFGLLELMKLDVANHQIRAFRYPLIDDTVPFQQDCFTKAIENGTLDTSRSKRWFRQARESHDRMCINQLRDCRHAEYRALIHGLVHLCNPAIKRIPNTLQYDYHRFVRLQEDLQDLIQTELCLQVFERRALEFDSSISRSAVQSIHSNLKTRIIALTEDEEGNGGAISDHLDAISIELTRSLSLLRSATTTQQQPQAGPDHVIHDFEFERTNKMLYEFFQEEDDEELVTGRFLAILEQRAAEHALQFLPLSPLEISNRQRQYTQARNKVNSGKPYLLADWDDLARRVAHIGAVHWKVWADLCYLQDDAIDFSEDLTSPVSVYGDERFYGDELSDIYSPSISSSSTAFSSPSTSQEPFINSEFQQGFAAMQQESYHNKNDEFSEPVFMELNEDMNNHVFDQEFEMDMGRDASTHSHKGNVRRSSM